MTQPAGTPDISAMLAQAQRLQQQLLEAQRQMAATEVQGRAGDGLVTVTVKGTGEVVAVSIDPKVVDPADINTLQDLIVGAFTDAFGQVTHLARTRLGPLAGGLSGTPGQSES